MGRLIIPENYEPLVSMGDTQLAIKKIKDYFQQELAHFLILRKTTAPAFFDSNSGLNDDTVTAGEEIGFTAEVLGDKKLEMVNSLAKWKRVALDRFAVDPGMGIFSEINTVRAQQEPDNLNSILTDVLEWEKVITEDERTEEFLRQTAATIFEVLKVEEAFVMKQYEAIYLGMPEELTFFTTQELENLYPDKTPEEREALVTEEYRAVFIMKIGGKLDSGDRHAERASDYEDWELNGDMLVWNDVLQIPVTLARMGIRVDDSTLMSQLEADGKTEMKELDYHSRVLNNELPYTIGGCFWLSRLCMYFLKKAHIGEVQVSVWPDEMKKECIENNIPIL